MNLTKDAHLDLIANFGQSDEQLKGWEHILLDHNVPGTDAIKEDRLVWIADKKNGKRVIQNLPNIQAISQCRL